MIKLDKWQSEILETKGNIVLVAGRQTGKSTIIAVRDSERAVKQPKQSILIIAPTERQSEEIFQKILVYISENYLKMISKGKDRPTKHIIKLKNGSVIRCLPVGLAGIGIRGLTINKLTAEEASYIPQEVWHAITPMLLTTGGDMDLLGTPHGQQGYFWEAYKNKDGRFKVFHVNTESVILNREISDTWTSIQRDRALEYLEREKKSMTKNQYLQEYAGEFIADVRNFFPEELIKEICVLKRQDGTKNHKKYYLGCDFARLGEDESTFEILDGTNQEKIEQVENIVTTKQLTTATTDKIIQLDFEYQFKKIGIDDGGLGVAILDNLLQIYHKPDFIIPLNNARRSLDADEKRVTKLMKEDMYNNLKAYMEKGFIKLLDDESIIESLKSVQYEYTTEPGKPTRMIIYGNYTHIAEGLIRALWICTRSKSLNLWVRYN